jgi:hypothetical protein
VPWPHGSAPGFRARLEAFPEPDSVFSPASAPLFVDLCRGRFVDPSPALRVDSRNVAPEDVCFGCGESIRTGRVRKQCEELLKRFGAAWIGGGSGRQVTKTAKQQKSAGSR